MNKRERARIQKAIDEGTVPCAICRKEHRPDSPAFSKGRCSNRKSCLKRIRLSGKFPSFVTLGRLQYYGAGSAAQQRMDLQAKAYYEHMEDQRRVDVYLI